MTSAVRSLLGFSLALLAVACGESVRSDDGGAAGAGPDGPECATDADCTDDVNTKCTESGTCVASNVCEVDADCRGDYKFCDTFGQCEPCRVDADCPSETPVCARGWEYGVWCAECRVGDSSTCPAGTYCTAVAVEVPGGGGSCSAPNCATDATAKECLACVNENAPACLGSGDACSAELEALRACHVAEVPGWTPDDCPTGVVPSERGCTPSACQDEAEAVETCLLACPAVTAACP